MKGSLLFRINRWLYFLLKGIGKRETEHYLFTISDHRRIDAFHLFCQLAPFTWQPNYMGYAYKGQIHQCRRLIFGGHYQYHLRFYDDGKVTGHLETSPEYDVSDHLSGAGLRTMNEDEINELRLQLEMK